MMENTSQPGNAKQLILAIVLSIIILAATIGGALYYNNYRNKAKVSTTSTTTITPTDTSTTDETANWQTYTNEEYGFSFKYPEGWKTENITKPKGIEGFITNVKNPESDIVDLSVYYYDTIRDIDGSLPKKGYTNLLDYLNDKSYISSYKEIDFAKQSGYEAIELGMTSYYTILVEKNNHIYQLLFNKPWKEKLTNTESQILSTFKFTD